MLTRNQGYRTHHSLTYPSHSSLQHRVNSYLTHFTKLEAARSKLLSRQRSVPDEDGFVTVTRGGRVGPARLEEAQAAAERLKEREKKRIGGDFYRFQTREGRKLKERELKDKYEEDKKKIQSMRERRGKIRPE
jgi:ribosomal RNA-processing protein 7